MQRASEFFKNFDRNSGEKSKWLHLLYNPIGCKNVAMSSSWASPTAFASGHFDRKSQNRGRATIPFVLFRNMVAEKREKRKLIFWMKYCFMLKTAGLLSKNRPYFPRVKARVNLIVTWQHPCWIGLVRVIPHLCLIIPYFLI